MELLTTLATDWHRFEATFNGAKFTQPLHQHDEIPVFLSAGYLFMVFWIAPMCFPLSTPNSEAVTTWIRRFARVWDFGVAAFSIYGASVTVPFLLDVLLSPAKGYEWSMCTDPRTEDYFYNGKMGVWMYLFVMSKIPEMMDTVFLILKRKRVSFLHWFHHLTVMLYCWHCLLVCTPSAMYFATMNYVVHSIMYSYYFFMGFQATRRYVKRVAIGVTSLQITQMIAGLLISAHAFILSSSTSVASTGAAAADTLVANGNTTISTTAAKLTCAQVIDPANAKMGFAMYGTYFALFLRFFWNTYFRSSVTKLTRSPTTTNGPTSSTIPARGDLASGPRTANSTKEAAVAQEEARTNEALLSGRGSGRTARRGTSKPRRKQL